jgi:tRNA (mo5U34)-methyltransferase
VTVGDCPPSILAYPGSIPDVGGKSVLDIGTWDGKYSFEAERAGAGRVVALDHYVWKLNASARQAYYDKCEAEGILPDPKEIDYAFLTEDNLPGKAGFDLAHEYLDSKVEAVVGDFMTMDLDEIGTFDVVFYFGVLYHMVDPMGGLERLRRVTKEVAVVETSATVVPGYPDSSLIEFYAGDELGADYGNWFVPSERALHGMCSAVGFRRIETKARTAVDEAPARREKGNQTQNGRIVVHAFV